MKMIFFLNVFILENNSVHELQVCLVQMVTLFVFEAVLGIL